VVVLDVLKELDALPIWKLLIEGDEVDRLGVQHSNGGTGRFRCLDIEKGPENHSQGVARSCLVVNHEQGRLTLQGLWNHR
jgi:hypothetical protein